MASVDLLDPWDPLDLLEPLASLDVRCDATTVHVVSGHFCFSPGGVHQSANLLCFREPPVTREHRVAMEPPDPR